MITSYEIYWLCLTLLQEAGAEIFLGKLAVAFVVTNRAKKEGGIIQAVLRPFQFSCWNTDSPTRRMIPNAESSPTWKDCVKAANFAYYEIAEDPSKGATHYLNPRILKKLPPWYSKDKIVAVVGAHEFLKL